MAAKERVMKMFNAAVSQIRSDFSAIENMDKAAACLLDCLKTDGNYPVPIVDIAKNMGFKIYMKPWEDTYSGFIAINSDLMERLGSNKIISVNQSHNLGHKRFTIAHEIAHYIFDFDENANIEYYDEYTKNGDADSEIEQRANAFAASLLMPQKVFSNKFHEYGKNNTLFETANQLAKDFQVSSTAIKRRIDELKLSPF